MTDRAIILAAGRGSRLGLQTENKPKCLVHLLGQPLLLWQVQALQHIGIKDITVVTGYRCEMIEAFGIPTIHNASWAATNMVASLMAARDLFDKPLLVSYSDIVYDPRILEKLRAVNDEIAVTYDLNWLTLWKERFEDPASDAESFSVDKGGYLKEIGKRNPNLNLVMGQYMGLLRISPVALMWIDELVCSITKEQGDRLDMTALLDLLINNGRQIKAVPTTLGWCEVDNEHDLMVATNLANQERFGSKFIK